MSAQSQAHPSPHRCTWQHQCDRNGQITFSTLGALCLGRDYYCHRFNGLAWTSTHSANGACTLAQLSEVQPGSSRLLIDRWRQLPSRHAGSLRPNSEQPIMWGETGPFIIQLDTCPATQRRFKNHSLHPQTEMMLIRLDWKK